MKLVLSSEQIERCGRWAVVLAGLGFVGLFVLTPFGVTYGVLSSMAALFLGALMEALKKYRTEPGVWMLASLMGLFGSSFWILFVLAGVVPSMRGTIPMPWPLAIDAAVCTAIWGYTARIVWSMGLYNYQNVRPRWVIAKKPPESSPET